LKGSDNGVKRRNKGFATIEYIVGIAIVAAIALIAFVYHLLPAIHHYQEIQPKIYQGDYYNSDN
jgi:type II secretory pathway component PulJ